MRQLLWLRGLLKLTLAVAVAAAPFGAGAVCFMLIKLPHVSFTYKTPPYNIIMNIHNKCVLLVLINVKLLCNLGKFWLQFLWHSCACRSLIASAILPPYAVVDFGLREWVQWAEQSQGGLSVCRQVACPMFTSRLNEMVGWARWRPATATVTGFFILFVSAFWFIDCCRDAVRDSLQIEKEMLPKCFFWMLLSIF